MSTNVNRLGARAIVLGGGIAGTLVARVLADHFDEVSVFERDTGTDADGFRKGVPQAKLVHAVLRAGLDRMNELFPGFEQELVEAGAVPCRTARDVFLYDSLGAWPRQDVGVEVPLLSRPLLERTLQRRLAGVPNVIVHGGLTVQELIADGERIAGVVCRDAAGASRRELGELIIDASGRSAHTPEWLRRLGFPAPDETRVEVDIGYAGCFVRPRRAPNLLGAMVSEPPPSGRYGSLVNAQEGGRMIVALGSRGRETPLPDDYAGLLARAEQLPHPIVFELMRDADPVSPVVRFGFPASVHRHYERLERVPEAFVCVGDAICSFNPIWGQGMSVAALEVAALGRMLAERAQGGVGLGGLPPAFYAETARLIATPWALSVGPDFAYDTTRGERGPEVQAGRGASLAFATLAQQDPEVRALLTDVYHLIKPREALFDPALVARVMALMPK